MQKSKESNKINVQTITLRLTPEKIMHKEVGSLSSFKEAISDTKLLEKAQNDLHTLLVDPRDLPKKAGWYLVIRGEEVSFKKISKKEAQKFVNEFRWSEVLYVNQSATNTAKSLRPVAELGIDYNFENKGWLYVRSKVSAIAKAVVHVESVQLRK